MTIAPTRQRGKPKSAHAAMAISVLAACGMIMMHGCAAQGSTTASAVADQSDQHMAASVTAFIHHYIQTLQGGDPQQVRDLFVSDDRFAWFTDGAQAYASADDVLAGMNRYADVRFATTVQNIRIVPIDNSTMLARSDFQTQLTIPNASDFAYGGVITWVLERSQCV